MTLRVVVDATPLLGVRTGVGRYVEGLLSGLARLDDPGLDVVRTAFTVRGAAGLAAAAPGPRDRVVHRPAPARALQWLWARTELPRAELLTGRADVLHATNFVLPPSRAAGVVTVHDLTFDRHADTVSAASLRYRELVPRSLARAELVLCPSRAVADELGERYGLPPERVRVTPLGVAAGWAAARPPAEPGRLGLPERYLLFVGAREPRKDLPVLLAAHQAARAADPSVPDLVLTGPPGWGAVGTGDATVTGFLSDADLRAVVAGAATLVLPSRYEGFGLPLLEALACGTPVLASDIPAHREVTGGLARLFPVGDVDALAGALLALQDPASGRAERRAFAAGFTWERCAALTANAYRQAAA